MYSRPNADFDPYDEVYARYESMVGRIEPLRRRIVEVPMQLDHPYWIDDPNFDLDFHVRHLSLAPPGRVDQLGEPDRPHRRPAPRPHPSPVGGLRHRGPRERSVGAADQVPARHRRRRLGRDDAEADARPDAGRARRPRRARRGSRSRSRPTSSCCACAIGNLVRNPAKAVRTQLRMVRDVAEAAGVTSVGAVARLAGTTVKTIAGGGERSRACRCRCRPRRRRRGTSRSRPTAASPCARRRWPTSSG